MRKKRTDAYIDEDTEIPDGSVVRVPVLLADGARRPVAFDPTDHINGYRTGDKYIQAYRQYCRDTGLPEASRSGGSQGGL